MTDTAVRSQGTTIGIDTGTAGVPDFTTIVNVTDISGFDGSANEIDITDLSSTAKERMLGLQDWGSLTLTCNINLAESTHMSLFTAKKLSTLKSYQVTLSDGTTIVFDAYVKSFPISAKVDAVNTGAIALTITGDITVTVAGA